MSDPRRGLPSVGALLERPAVQALLDSAPRTVVVNAVRTVVEEARARGAGPVDGAGWDGAITAQVAAARASSLRPVINATGVVLHTNLGRAPLAPVALDAILATASGYSTLEYDLARGVRGSRYDHCARLLCELTGAEDALVVNNGAAALVLALNTLADGREAVLSRGELVEIGDGFRVHEIIGRSGARLREVGATNRTHAADYARALGPDTGALLKVHRSNFSLTGFVHSVPVSELLPFARERDLPILHDLGSGLLISLDELGLHGEPTAGEAVREGASVVVMSGDKLLGGPQAGLIVGEHRYLSAMRRNPLARSYRVDKLTLAALEATLALHRTPERAIREIPTLALLASPVSALRARGSRLAALLAAGGVTAALIESEASVGAGAFPAARLPSVALALDGDATRWAESLRRGDPPVIGRIVEGRLQLDLRSVLPAQDEALHRAVRAAHE